MNQRDYVNKIVEGMVEQVNNCTTDEQRSELVDYAAMRTIELKYTYPKTASEKLEYQCLTEFARRKFVPMNERDAQYVVERGRERVR